MPKTKTETLKKPKLSAAMQKRIAANRQKALDIRAAKLVQNPNNKGCEQFSDAVITANGKKFIDSGGGFLIEGDGTEPEENPNKPVPFAEEPINLPIEYEECLECHGAFVKSFLNDNFGHAVCDQCRNDADTHALITRTEAKQEYLLKDCDLDKRPPPLKFITRKNPHNAHWGDMKLYLHLQVEKRALEVWGSEEGISEQLERREEKREKTKLKRFSKNLKQLRMEMRSSLYDKTIKPVTHQHTFGADFVVDADEDLYEHTCSECGFSEQFEKM